jgi:two-component system, OmpR family, KDP operon response regulator KdpE
VSGARILVVDDDPAILRAVRRALQGHGYDVTTAKTAREALEAHSKARPEVILLDLVLPDGTGLAVCEAVRQSSDVPIIVLSAVDDDGTKVEALDRGADDYLTKPFSMEELRARIRVALRRQAHQTTWPVLHAGSIELNVESHEVTVARTPIHLTPKEFELCRVLMENQGRVLTQRHVLTRVWGAEYADDTHILRTFVHQLRSKLAAVSAEAAALIVNDPGVGYRLVANS